MLETLAQLPDTIGACIDAPMWPLSDADLVAGPDPVHRAEQALAAVKLHLILHRPTPQHARAPGRPT